LRCPGHAGKQKKARGKQKWVVCASCSLSWETKTKRCEHMAHGRGRGVNFWPGVHSLFPASAVQMSIVIIATARHFDDVCQGRGAHIARRQSECQFVRVRGLARKTLQTKGVLEKGVTVEKPRHKVRGGMSRPHTREWADSSNRTRRSIHGGGER
jgi:hypothetical protein